MTLESLMAALGHAFSDRGLLRTALTHRSFGTPNNERLEFIGDGVLNCVIGLALFKRYPALSEGDLTRLRATLVRRETLHRIALDLDLGSRLHLSEGELKGGGASTPSILADAVEALIGAIYLDGGFEAASAAIARLYLPLFDELKTDRVAKDAKTRLQEWLQGRRHPLPRYDVHEIIGNPPNQRFVVACNIADPPLRAMGEGASRRAAEQVAADNALKALET